MKAVGSHCFIASFKGKPLAALWHDGTTPKIDARMLKWILVRLDRLNVVVAAEEMNLPGYDFHALKGFVPTRHGVHVNGPWCITSEFGGKDAAQVDFGKYR